MRLKKLTIQAFGPFKDRVVIDFEGRKIDRGLLLITGDTGAGKTSIFDAICFALYGEASSEVRKSNSLRSDFASPDLDTFVELTFYHNNKEYTVKRSPEYERRSKRGDGTTKQAATAEFEINGRIETKTKIVTEEITKLLGLDYKQFHQVTMLSQGEFTKFLLATSDEKTSIFRKIFNTDIYERIMIELKNRASMKEQSFNLIKNNIDREREKLKGDYSAYTTLALIEELEKKIKESDNVIADIKKKRDKLNDNIIEKQTNYDKLDELNKKIEKYNTTKEQLSKLLEDNKNIEEDIKLVDYNHHIVSELTTIINDLETNQKELKDNIESHKRLTEDKKKLDELIKSKKEEFKKLDNYDKEYEKLSNEIVEIKNYKEILGTYNKNNELLITTQKQYKEALDKYREENENYLLLKENYYADLAYSLSANLKDNEPCPVCGSKEHPKPAKSTISNVSKSDLDAEERKVTTLSNNVKSLETKIEEYKKNIEDLKLKEDFNYDKELDMTDTLISSNISMLDSLKESNKKLLSEKEELTNRDTRLKTELTKLEEDNVKYKNRVEDLEDRLKNYLKDNKTTLEEYNEKRVDKNTLAELDRRIKEFNLNKNTYETTIKNLNDEVEGKKIERLGEKRKELEELKKTKEELEANYLDLNNENSLTKSIKDSIEKYQKVYDDTKLEYSIIKELSDTANAKLTGKQRITFENYVQSSYLKSVLIEANKRLFKMTDGRYELKRKETSRVLTEKLGLEFSVFDAYTGKERDVSSLSGGEKFKASLSLALGLSDVISMYAGGIKMDCLFVDEGFGSLDPESLNQALNTLSDLADNDKLIGIISHVSELVSRIDNKIKVKKDTTGSNIEITS